MHWIMLTILLQNFPPQFLSLAIIEEHEKRELQQQFIAMTPNYNVVVGKQHFENYHYIKDHYNNNNGKQFPFFSHHY